MESSTGELADLERDRLKGIISLVFEGDSHYDPACTCKECQGIRKDLSPEDRDFVDHIARTVGNPNA
jgi:hypothetical protein